MSTIAYAQLTNVRDSSPPGASTSTHSPGIRTYVDAFAALVPAEVLTLHALVIAVVTETSQKASAGDASEIVTAILPQAIATLQIAFWALILMSMALYAVPRYFGGKWNKFDWIRITVSPLAFLGWTMLQRTTAFDAAFPEIETIPRTVSALFLGAALGAITAGLALQADKKPIP